MKYKLIQIVLGAIGSAITVLVAHFAQTPVEAVPPLAVAAGLGSPLLVSKIEALRLIVDKVAT